MGKYTVHPEGTLLATESGSKVVARKVTIRGDYLQIKSMAPPRGRCGGGVRVKKHGHSANSERNLKKYIFARKMADYVLWLTFPYLVTPQDAVTLGKNYSKKIERQMKAKIAYIMKLEPQPGNRLCPELTLLIWVKKKVQLNRENMEEEWQESLKSGRTCVIELRRINQERYPKLVNYFCKKIMFHDDYSLECGGSELKVYTPEMLAEPVILGFEEEVGDLVRSTQVMNKYTERVHSWIVEASGSVRGSEHIVLTKRNLFDAWRSYTGSFHFKYHKGDIPKYKPRVEIIEAWELKQMMGEINHTRKNHFVSETQGFSLLGDSARMMKKRIPSLG